MSRIIWMNSLLPGIESLAATETAVLEDAVYKDRVENVRMYSRSNGEIAIPDQKSFRSMSRASLFLSNVCMSAGEVLEPFLNESPFSVGIYCAVENGPIDGPSTAKILEQNAPEKFAEFYRKFRNPKMYLKQLPNLVAAQMGISMHLQGPMNVYTHSRAGGLHALDQAESDLQNGTVKAALVCSAHAFDDFLVVKRTRKFDSRCLTEGAAALLLENDGNYTDWSRNIVTDSANYFGISDPIINLIRGVNYVK